MDAVPPAFRLAQLKLQSSKFRIDSGLQFRRSTIARQPCLERSLSASFDDLQGDCYLSGTWIGSNALRSP
ncbi:hypothetical protein KC357_g87 [Hortaea werneckii]|nr:hypothetical protein KC357_g87 [Hortaea werneckii]